MLVANSMSCCRAGRFPNSRPGTMLTRRRIRRVGRLSVGVLIASDGRWLNWDMILWTCACDLHLLSDFLFMVRMRCTTLIWVALSPIGGSLRPAFLSWRLTPSVRKFGRSPIDCLIALLSMPSMVVSWRSFRTPRWVACYFYFRSCSTTRVLYAGLGFFLESAVASFLTTLVLCVWCSLKSSTMLICTPSILCDFLGGRYLMCEPSGMWWCWFALVLWIGF